MIYTCSTAGTCADEVEMVSTCKRGQHMYGCFKNQFYFNFECSHGNLPKKTTPAEFAGHGYTGCSQRGLVQLLQIFVVLCQLRYTHSIQAALPVRYTLISIYRYTLYI